MEYVSYVVVTICCVGTFVMMCPLYRLQEIATDDDHESGRIPRTVDCELTRELGNYWASLVYKTATTYLLQKVVNPTLSCSTVDCCVPGDVVTVCGIVKVVSTDEGT